jgi:flagellar hook protein FlgE
MPLTSFNAALTGLNSSSTAINVIGNNLANMNTTAFKKSNAAFSELLAGLSSTSETGNPTSTGLGSEVSGVNISFAQGTINSTAKSTDAAISGNGFFVVSTGDGLGYTRSGSFELDKEGYLVSSDGLKVMGYPAVDGKIDNSADVSDIQIRLGQSIPGTATKNINITANLDAQANEGTTFSTSVQVFDSLGAAHEVKLTFAKRAGAGDWSWSATMSAVDTGGNIGDPPTALTITGAGDLQFDSNGKLTVTDPTAANPTMTLAGLTNGAADLEITLNLWDSLGKSTFSGYASASAVSSTSQDGIGSSILSDISINSDGVILGQTASGQSIKLAQLVIATFQNTAGLQKSLGSTFTAFSSAGEPSIGIAGVGGRGSVVGSALEQSNVDMAEEFVNLIQAQRAYQASSKVITTSDELVQDAINLKR